MNMSATLMPEQIPGASPRFKARIAGVFYLLTFVGGIIALVSPGARLAANLIGDLCYVAVALLFYELFKPVNRNVSGLAAFVGLAGCANGVLSLFHLAPFHINSLVFFGFYCIVIGYLIFRSTFLPRILGVLMAGAGLGWLTFVSPPLAQQLSPWNMISGALCEGALMVWLIVIGVNDQRWREQAGLRQLSSARPVA